MFLNNQIPGQMFAKENTQKAHKMEPTLVIREMQIQTTVRDASPHTHQNAKIKG